MLHDGRRVGSVSAEATGFEFAAGFTKYCVSGSYGKFVVFLGVTTVNERP